MPEIPGRAHRTGDLSSVGGAMDIGHLILVLLAIGVILAGAAHFTPRIALLCAIAAVVLGGVVLVLELAAV